MPGSNIILDNTVTYSHAQTSTITAISPAFASSAGGDTLTITGTNFGTTIIITIDGVDCPVSSQTLTVI